MLSLVSLGASALQILVLAAPALAAHTQDEAKKPSIAVLPFRMTDLRQHAGGSIHLKENEVNLLTNRFITALVQTRKFTVVEREKLENLLKEMDLTKSGIVDAKRGVQIGKMIGASYFLTGEITNFNAKVSYAQVPYTKRYSRTTVGRISVQLRLIDTETSAIVAAQAETFEDGFKDPLVDEGGPRREDVAPEFLEHLQNGIVAKLVSTVVDACYPIKVVSFQTDVVYLNRGEGGGLALGDALTAFTQGETLIDPDTKEVLGSAETPLAKLEVIEVAAKMTKARVVRWFVEKKELPKGTLCRRDVATAAPAAGAKEQGGDKPKIPD